ncbi:hypothetical protein AGQ53_26240 [Salmonella enterica subsp. enterica]|nr:hypothetical protein AGQ53_26240 [Salmonella enterica subsp. enterica]
MAGTGMVGDWGFWYRPFYRFQEEVFPQKVKQAGPFNISPFKRLCIPDLTEFMRIVSGRTAPGTGNKIENLSMMLLPFITSCIVLVPRLSAVLQELACTRNCYFGGLTLREDLPGRFFTTLTP